MLNLIIYYDSEQTAKDQQNPGGRGSVESMKDNFWEEQVKQLTTNKFNVKNQRALKILINTNGCKKILQP